MSSKKSINRSTVTMIDVANRAGVSLGTVSHVLNNTASVSQKRREIVLRAARELDYQPNLVAKSLRISATKTIGMIVSNLENPFFTEIVHAIQETVAEHGYDLLVASDHEKPELETLQVANMRSKQVDGMILAPTSSDSDSLVSLLKSEMPVVLISKRVDKSGIPAIISDNTAAVKSATTHLITNGFRRIGIVLHDLGGSHTEDQLQGYKEALAMEGIVLSDTYTALNENSSAGGFQATNQLLSNEPRPDAIICGTAMMTRGVLRCFKEHQIICPQDIALIASGSFPWADFLDPPLTHITQPTYEIGKRAVGLLIKIIDSKEIALDSGQILHCGFHHGKSCGCT